MKIEPEALYSLFESLIIPQEKSEINAANTIEIKSNDRLKLLLNKQLDDIEKDFLYKILASINLKIDDVELIFDVNSENISKIINENSGYILAWGIDYVGIEKYKLAMIDGVSLIVVDSLIKVKNDQSLKTQLWNCLKETFLK